MAKVREQAPRGAREQAPYPAFDGTQHCHGADDHLFFPPPGRETYEALTQARDICSGCPFLRPCLSYALTWDLHGFWAGTSQNQRREIQKQHGLYAPRPSLSDAATHEQDVRRLAGVGLSDREIADRTGLSPRSVLRIRHKTHREAS